MDNIVNPRLYLRAKKDADLKYARDGLYKSAYIQKRYKELGGKYKTPKPSQAPISRWLSEQWIQVYPYVSENKIVQCGSSKDSENIACRPRKKIDPKNTPITIDEVIAKHGKAKVKELAMKKEKNKSWRVDWVNGTISP